MAVAPDARRYDLLGESLQSARADLTLPNNEDAPAGLSQLALMCPISLLSPRQLGMPIVSVAIRDAAVSASSMLVPEAAVDEDRGQVALEHYIWFPRQACDILSESESAPMEIRSNLPLR